MMDLFLRGHIRNAFGNRGLYDVVNRLVHDYPSMRIYIRTWNTMEASSSWRKLRQPRMNSVDEDLILDYFCGLENYIKGIQIDTEEAIHPRLVGELSGNIANTACPKIPWKRMWAQKYFGLQTINKTSKKEHIINTRFDILSLPGKFKFTYHRMDDMIQEIIEEGDNWLFDQREAGVDNFYIGRKDLMIKHHAEFHNNLDGILANNQILEPPHQEKLTKIIALRKYNE